MTKPVISVEALGKAYHLGQRVHHRHQTLRDAVTGWAKGAADRLRHRVTDAGRSADAFWAVRNVSFDVHRGEVVGIIGRNGAGKSTLLKVLSRITEPTEGRAVLRGRVGSLLEVGTGFHPELSGRENIYLNGSILGMRKTEIDRKFDEIVAFAEVEKFLDTPVKRYSSGMYVRLAFAVAAHLEPEILIVDEVLAVGDAAFQKKCLGKMGDVVRQGRTVLFVSHNMDAIASLCSHVILVKNGTASERLTPDDGVKQYLALGTEGADLPLRDRPRQQDRPRPPVFTGLTVTGSTGHPNIVGCGDGVTFEVDVENLGGVNGATCGIAVSNQRHQRVAFFHTLYHGGVTFNGVDEKTRMVCRVPSLPLVPGSYFVELVLSDGYHVIEKIEAADRLEIVFADVLGTGKVPNQNQGFVVLPCEWNV